jgi:hypothetical protein
MTNTTFAVGGDIEVRRLGFGAMRITGPGIWGPPRDRAAARALLRRGAGSPTRRWVMLRASGSRWNAQIDHSGANYLSVTGCAVGTSQCLADPGRFRRTGWPFRQMVALAACSMTSVTVSGSEIIDRCPAFTSVMWAAAR